MVHPSFKELFQVLCSNCIYDVFVGVFLLLFVFFFVPLGMVGVK